MSRRGWLLFAAMCIIWGLPYLLIRIAVRDLSPPTLVFLRTASAAVVLAPFALIGTGTGDRWRQVYAAWRWVLAYTVVEVTVPWLLLSNAETKLSSSLSGLLVAAVPLVGVVLNRFSGTEDAVDARRLAGLAVGLGGVVALLGLDLGHVNAAAAAEVLVVAVGYACGPMILSHRLSQLAPLPVVLVSLLVTAVVYAPVAALRWPHHVSGEVVGSVVVLAVVCTAAAFVLFLRLIAEVGPSRAVVITYLNPAVALALGVSVLGEQVTLGMAVGFPLVLAGSVLATRRSPGNSRVADSAELPATSAG